MKRMTPAEQRAVWEQRLDRYSGWERTVADFCKVEGISPAAFYRWKSRLGSRRSTGETLDRKLPGESSQRRPVVSAATSNRRAAAATSFTELVVTTQPNTKPPNAEPPNAELPNAELPNAEHPNAEQLNAKQQIAEQSDVARAELPNGILISLGRDTTLAAAIVDRLVRYEPADEAIESNATRHHESNATCHQESNSARRHETHSTRGRS